MSYIHFKANRARLKNKNIHNTQSMKLIDYIIAVIIAIGIGAGFAILIWEYVHGQIPV